MVSVVHFTINNFRLQFFKCVVWRVLVQLGRWGWHGGRGGETVKAWRWSRAEPGCRCLPADICFFCLPFYLHSQFYTHFICTYGTQINYKCELSSKLLKDHLYCSLWSHLLSPPLNHAVFMQHIVLHFKPCTVQIGSYICYIAVLWHMVCVCVCLWSMSAYFSLYLHVFAAALREKKVNVWLFSFTGSKTVPLDSSCSLSLSHNLHQGPNPLIHYCSTLFTCSSILAGFLCPISTEVRKKEITQRLLLLFI